MAYVTILEFKTSLYTRVGRTSTTRIRRRRFFFPTSQESEGFFFYRRATSRTRTWKPMSSAMTGPSPK